jgi:hypothetical protein
MTLDKARAERGLAPGCCATHLCTPRGVAIASRVLRVALPCNQLKDETCQRVVDYWWFVLNADQFKLAVMAKSRNKPYDPDWGRMLERAKRNDWTFKQAEAWYAREHGWNYPDRNWPGMPMHASDFCKRVQDVPASRLRD